MLSKALVFVAFVASFLPLVASAEEKQSSPWGTSVSATVAMPLPADQAYFQTGWGTALAVDYRLGSSPLQLGSDLAWSLVPSTQPGFSLSILDFTAKTTLDWSPFVNWKVFVDATAGGFYAQVNDALSSSGANPSMGAGLGLSWRWGDDWVATVQGGIRTRVGLMTDTPISLSLQYQPGKVLAAPAPTVQEFQTAPNDKKGLKLIGLKASVLVPTLWKSYEKLPFAKVVLKNFESTAITGATLTLESKGFLTGGRELVLPAKIAAGVELTIDVPGPLSEKLLNFVEPGELPLSFTLKYVVNSKKASETVTLPIAVRGRNTLTWDDMRHLAAFISPRDPGAYALSRGVLATVKETANSALGAELQGALVLQTALRLSGVSFLADPSSPFRTNKLTVPDAIQFPSETLRKRTGDADDLTVLFCSVLEASGIESAIVSAPGQIFPAFALPLKLADAQALWGSSDDYLVRDGKVWIPLDPALVASDFQSSWKSAAKQIRAQQGPLSVLPVRQAWTTTPPVVAPGLAAVAPPPTTAKLVAATSSEVTAFVQKEFDPRSAKIQADLKAAQPALAPQFENRLGVLYARYGYLDQSIAVFKKLLTKNYRPAFINLGNAYLLSNLAEAALGQFQAALRLQADDKLALAGVVLVYQSQGEQEQWKTAMEKLTRVDPDRANALTPFKLKTGAIRPDLLAWRE